MRRFFLVADRDITKPLLSQFLFMATSSAVSDAVKKAEKTTLSEQPQHQKENFVKKTSISLVQLLASVADDMQKRSSNICKRNTLTCGKTEGGSDNTTALTATTTASTDDNNENITFEPFQKLSQVQFINAISVYLSGEEKLALLGKSKLLAARRQYSKLRAINPRLSPLQRDIIFYEASRVVEKREVPLFVAAGILRPRWPEYFMDVFGSRHHSFIAQSLRVWVADLLKEGKLTAPEARKLLVRCPRIFYGHVSLMGSVVECALADISTLDKPELLIQLMWAVNNAKTHAPDHFWRRVVDKLAIFNRSLRDKVADVISFEKQNGGKDTATNRAAVGHVFSGLTTRQLFRVLRVLQKEHWCGDVTTILDFVDKALKNIVFETEALRAATDNTQSGPLSRRAVIQRVKKTADMSPVELLSLLSIASDLGVDFRAPMVSLSEYLLSPMVRYLNREQLFLLTTCVRRTHCDSPQLIQTIIDSIVRCGVMHSSSVGLTKAGLRTVLQRPSLLSQLNLSLFVAQVFHICGAYQWGMRASQILSWVELLYALSRRFAPSSSVGVQVRACVESFAAPLFAMLSRGVVPTSVVSRVLEHTVILGMRNKPQYPLTAKLWEGRNAVVNRRNARLLVLGNVDNNCTELQTNTATAKALDDVKSDDDTCFVDEAPRSVRLVYENFISTYERQMIMRLPLSREEELCIIDTIQHIGLYSIFLAAKIMKDIHLVRHDTVAASNTPGPSYRTVILPSTLSAWMERQISIIITKRIHDARLSHESTDDVVLRVFGHRHCDVAKVCRFQQLVQGSPLRLVSQQRILWEYIFELARRFGGEKEKALAQQVLANSFY